MGRAARWVETVTAALEQKASVQTDIRELSAYYGSDLWMEDYEADEAGALPEELKRGVLSEDGLYNLLAAYEEVQARLCVIRDRNALQRGCDENAFREREDL